MIDQLSQQVNRINDKLQLVLRQVNLLQKENEALKSAMKLSTLELEKCRKSAGELEQQLAVIKMAAGEMNEKDKKEMEKRLNLYIREVDRCISFLQE